MSSATWSPETDGTPAPWASATEGNSGIWDKDKTRGDLERTAPTYDDSTLTYDSITIFYDGFDPSAATPEGETGTIWAEASE